MLRVSLRLLRPGTARSWKSGKNSSTSKHFAFAHSSERAPAHVKAGTSAATSKQQDASSKSAQDDDEDKRPSDASRAASKYGNSFFALWNAINPARNYETIAKKPWLRRAVVWASTIKLAEFGHISYFLGPAFVGTGLGTTVAVVRESCDTLALQVPFIPLHLAMLHVLVLWSAMSLTYIVQALVQQVLDRRRGVKKTEGELLMQIKPVDAVVASVVHTFCVSILLLWSQWSVISVVLYASPLMAFHFVTYRFPSPPVAPVVAEGKEKQLKQDSNSNNSSSQQQRSVAASSAKLSNEQQEANTALGEPSRVAMLADSMLLAIPTTMGYCAVLGRVDPVVTAPLALAALSWGAMWHTFGGGKAVWFTWRGKKQVKLQQMVFTYSSYFALNIAGYMAGQTLFFYVMLAWAHWHMLGVIDHFRPNDPWSIAQARRRLRISVWLVFLAVCAGNVLWLMLVNAVSFVHDVEKSEEFQLEEKKPFAEPTKKKIVSSSVASSGGDDDSGESSSDDDQKSTTANKKSGGVKSMVKTVLTMNVHPSPHSSMDQFSWMERIVKPVLVYATVQENLRRKKEGVTAADAGQPQQLDLSNLELPLCYKREFLGENVIFLMRWCGMFTEEQIGRFEQTYFSIIDHYTPFGSM